jgi:hypothetical protein
VTEAALEPDAPAPAPAEPAPQADAEPQAEAPPPAADPAQAQRVHVLDAAAQQRERVLTSFTDQREAIIKAVADQRAAAVAPIDAVRARLGKGNLRRPQPATRPPAEAGVAAEIVAILKALIAEEVRLQVHALLQPEDATAARPPVSASHP